MASKDFVIGGWLAIVVYAVVILFFVVRGAIRTKSIEDYALGSIAFSPIAVGLALAASMTSAATFIINPGFIAFYGISGFISLGLVFALSAVVSLVVLTKSFRRLGKSMKAMTLAQWIGSRYDSPNFALFFGFVSLLLISFVVLICVGLTKLLAVSLNQPESYVLAGVISFVFGYMMFGGANSMVYTNMVQAGLMIVVAVILLGSGFEHFSSGINGFLDKLVAIDPLLVAPTNSTSPLFRDYFEIIFCQIFVGVAVVCQPHIITKSLMLRDESQVNKYLVVGVVVEMLFFFVVFTGLYARLEFPDLTLGGKALPLDGVLSAYVVAKFPAFLGLIVVMGLISAGLSTLEGLIQTLSTTITNDVLKPLLPQLTVNQVLLNRATIVFLAVIAFIVSQQQLVAPDLSVGIFAQNGVYAYFSAAFVPVLMGMYLQKVPAWVPFSSAVTAIAVHFTMYYGRIGSYMQDPVRNPAIASTAAIISALLIGAIGYVTYIKSSPTIKVKA